MFLGELVPKSANGESKKAPGGTETGNKAFGPQNPHHNQHHGGHRRTHIRSRSDASALMSSSVRSSGISGSGRHPQSQYFRQILNGTGLPLPPGKNTTTRGKLLLESWGATFLPD